MADKRDGDGCGCILLVILAYIIAYYFGVDDSKQKEMKDVEEIQAVKEKR